MPRLSDNPALVQGRVTTVGNALLETAYPAPVYSRQRLDLYNRMQYRNTALDYAIKVNAGVNGMHNANPVILTTAKAFYKFLRFGKGID